MAHVTADNQDKTVSMLSVIFSEMNKNGRKFFDNAIAPILETFCGIKDSQKYWRTAIMFNFQGKGLMWHLKEYCDVSQNISQETKLSRQKIIPIFTFTWRMILEHSQVAGWFIRHRKQFGGICNTYFDEKISDLQTKVRAYNEAEDASLLQQCQILYKNYKTFVAQKRTEDGRDIIVEDFPQDFSLKAFQIKSIPDYEE